MKAHLGCFMIASIIAIVLALVLGAALDISSAAVAGLFVPDVRECRLVLFEDNSWYSPDYSPSEGFPPDPPCVWVFEESDCE